MGVHGRPWARHALIAGFRTRISKPPKTSRRSRLRTFSVRGSLVLRETLTSLRRMPGTSWRGTAIRK
jgi:hypothetical protein